MSSCNCTELARIAAIVDGNELKGLAKRSEHPGWIIGTYVLVILPWTILYNFDFISEKWRSIHQTRNLGWVHLAIAILPMPILIYYALLQRISKDYKEMMTAVIGLLLCLYHVMRTAWGLLQLCVFSNWCYDLIQRMEKLDMIENKRWKSIGDTKVRDWKGCFMKRDEKVENWECLRENRDRILRVNNTIVDNELSGTDLAVTIKKNKIGFSNPSKWLQTKERELCTVRWSGAFLCSFGEFWGGSNSKGFASKEELDKVFAQFRGSLSALHLVTFIKEGNRCSLNMIDWNNGGPYESSLVNADLPRLFKALELRKIALENVMGSYTGGNAVNKFRHPENGLVCALQYAQCLDEESIDALVEYSNKFNNAIVNITRNSHGWGLLVWQNRDSVESMALATTVPTWPWGKLMVPLWDSCTNWRVLQASVHMDNIVISPGRDPRSGGRPPKCFFEHTREKQQTLEKAKSYKPKCFGYTGCILEMVRSFLAEWMVTSTSLSEKTDWSPPLRKETSEFAITRSADIIDENLVKRDPLNQWRWEFQSILQQRIATTERCDTNLPASLDLILLFILAFPGSLSEQDRNNSRKSQANTNNSQKSSAPGPSHSPDVSADHTAINMADEGQDLLHVFLFQTRIAPQNIKVQVSVYGNENVEEKKVVMELICNKSVKKFMWQNWINCAMGYIQSRDEHMVEHPEWFDESTISFRKRTPTKADLSLEMLTVKSSDPELPDVPGDIQVWKGWPFFDVKLAQFEINQWMQKAGYLRGFCEPVPPAIEKGWDLKFKTELIRAEEGLLKIMERIRN